MSQITSAAMPFGPAVTHPALSHWWAGIETAIAAAVRRMFASATAGPTPSSTYHSYLEDACMAREMYRL